MELCSPQLMKRLQSSVEEEKYANRIFIFTVGLAGKTYYNVAAANFFRR